MSLLFQKRSIDISDQPIGKKCDDSLQWSDWSLRPKKTMISMVSREFLSQLFLELVSRNNMRMVGGGQEGELDTNWTQLWDRHTKKTDHDSWVCTNTHTTKYRFKLSPSLLCHLPVWTRSQSMSYGDRSINFTQRSHMWPSNKYHTYSEN